jgi:hypothetical protein
MLMVLGHLIQGRIERGKGLGYRYSGSGSGLSVLFHVGMTDDFRLFSRGLASKVKHDIKPLSSPF